MRNSLHSNAPSSKRNWSESSDISSPSTTRQPRYSYSSVITPSAVASSSTSATPPIQASSAAFFHTPAIASQAMQLQPNLSPTLERQRSQALISHNNFSKMPISSLPHIESSDTVLDACMFEPFYHNPAKDHISNDPIYHPAYIKAVEHVKMMIAILRSLISPDKLRDPVWFEIAQDLEKDLHPYRSADVRVAVAGMLGEGKSMLVGALLGNAGVTKSSESGQSCTKIPTEYYYLKKTENVNYAADFILFGWKKNESRVIRSFEFMANYLSSEDSQSPEDCEDEKFEKSRALLGALFPDSKKFNYKKTPETENQDKAELKEYLSQEDTLKNLLEDTKWFYDEASSQLSKEHFATKEQLWGRLCLFTRNVYSAGSSPNLWPFVKLIRIGGDFPALQHGVRIADLPGLNDIDYINQEATHTYLSQSSATIVVQRISRAIDGIDGRRAFVEIMKSSPNAHSMAMVLTHSEDVEPRSLEAHGLQDETFRKAERREFEELDCYISEIDCERSWCRDPQMMARNSLKLRLIQRRKRELWSSERNRRVARALPADKIQKVFPVSAKDYKRNIDGYTLDGQLPLSPKDSGIPDVLQWVATRASSRRQEDIKNFIKIIIPSRINSMEMACRTSRIINGMGPIGGMQQQIEICLRAVEDGLDRMFGHRITELLRRMKSYLPGWIDHAKHCCNEWEGVHPWTHRQHKVWIRNHGDHKTISIGPSNWNIKLQRVVCRDIKADFDEIVEKLRDDLMDTEEKICSVLDDMIAEMQNNRPEMSPRALGYIDRLELTKNEVGILFDKIVEILKGFFTLQRTNSCEYNVETSYLKEGMDKLYNSSNRARPETRSKTLHSVRCQVFREGLCDAVRSPYMGIYTNLEMACNSEKERINNLITGDLRKVFAQLSANLENMRPTHNCHESRTTAKMEDTLQQLKKLKEKNLSMHNDLLVESWYGS